MGVNRQQFLDKFLNNENPVQVYPAEVLSVEGHTCTVRLLASGLEVPDVRLRAETDNDDYSILFPRVNSIVLVGCIENDVANLYVAQFGEVDSAEIIIGDMSVKVEDGQLLAMSKNCTLTMTDDTISVEQSGTKVQLQGRKVNVTNGAVSLKDIFDDLASLIQNLKVVTAQGPSTALLPDSIAALTAFKLKYPQLLA